MALRQSARRPWLTLSLCLALLAIAVSGVGRVDYDATLESDADAAHRREIAARYGLQEFVVITATPDGPLLAPSTLRTIGELVDNLRSIPGVSAVQSLLDAPLVRNVDGRLAALADNYRTLRRDDVDLERAWTELTSSPLYRDTLVSGDGHTTFIEVVLAPAGIAPTLIARLAYAINMRCPVCLTSFPAAGELLTAATQNRPVTLAAIATVLAQRLPTLHATLSGAPLEAERRARALADDLVRGAAFSVPLLGLVIAGRVRDRRRFFIVTTTTLASVLCSLGLAGWSGLALNNLSVVMVPLALAANALSLGRMQMAFSVAAPVGQTVHAVIGLSGVIGLVCAGIALVFAPVAALAEFGMLLLLVALSALFVGVTLLPALATLLRLPPTRAALAADGATPRWRAPLVAASVLGAGGIVLLEQAPRPEPWLHVPSAAGVTASRHVDNEFELDILLAFPPAPTLPEAQETNNPDDELLAAIEHDNALDDNWFTPTIVDRITAIHVAMEALPGRIFVRSLASTLRVAEQLNGGVAFNAFDLNLIYRRLPRAVRAAVVEPYVAIAANEARVVVRLAPGQLAPDARLARVRLLLEHELGLSAADYRLEGTLVSAAQRYATLTASTPWIMLALLLLQATVLRVLCAGDQGRERLGVNQTLLRLVPAVAGVALALGLSGWAGLPFSWMTLAACVSALALSWPTGAEPTAYGPLLTTAALLPLLGSAIAPLADYCALLILAAIATEVFRLAFLASTSALGQT